MQPSFSTPKALGPSLVGPEPEVHVTGTGRIFVGYLGGDPLANGTGGATLWRSDDGGATYGRLLTRGLRGGGDSALAFPAGDEVHYVGLQPQAPSLPFHASADGGRTWSDAFDVADGALSTDRPWLDELPGNVTLVTWKEGAHLQQRMRSPSGWGPVATIADNASFAGPPVHSPGARALYVPYTTSTGFNLFVAVSLDQGKTWLHRLVTADLPRVSSVSGTTSLFPVAAVDAAGTVYVVWSATQPAVAAIPKPLSPQGIYYAASTDGGASWGAPVLLSTAGHSAVFPWISAGLPGRVVVTWYENRLGLPNAAPDVWDAVLVESVTADHADAAFLGGRLNTVPIHLGQICDQGVVCTVGDRSRGDFFTNTINRNGQPLVAWVQDGDTPGQAEVVVGGVEHGTPLW